MTKITGLMSTFFRLYARTKRYLNHKKALTVFISIISLGFSASAFADQYYLCSTDMGNGSSNFLGMAYDSPLFAAANSVYQCELAGGLSNYYACQNSVSCQWINNDWLPGLNPGAYPVPSIFGQPGNGPGPMAPYSCPGPYYNNWPGPGMNPCPPTIIGPIFA